MRTIIFIFLAMMSITVNAQKTNLDKLTEKERNDYLVKVAYEAVMKHAPGWYRDYREPEIKSFIPNIGDDRGRLQYFVTWFYDPTKETMRQKYSIGVEIYADTGEVRGLGFGDGIGYIFHLEPKPTRSGESTFFYPFKEQRKLQKGETY